MSFAVYNSRMRSSDKDYHRLPEDTPGDNHQKWNGPGKGTHSTTGIVCIFVSATLIFYGAGRLFGLIP